ncbi:MAG: T9SS type A sorting domain-containing protein [Bacteriodetes bacterium]|nr:T9SS type A sorting domain-containing protein [Bacteroidota bacterium]
MKTTCVLLALVGITTTFCFSQTPVPLEEWLVSKGYPDSSASPPIIAGVTNQFSVVNGFRKDPTKQSIVIGKIQPKTFSYTIETWLNRFQGDTLNEFTWGSGFHPEGIVSLDINGDGNTDYLNRSGRLFLGTSEGVPDTTKRYVFGNHPHIRAGSRKNTYGDVDSDGKDDVFYYHVADKGYPYLMSIMLGNADVSNVKTTHIQSPVLSDTTMHEVAVVLFKNKSGSWRLLTYTWANYFFQNPPPGKWVNIPEKSEIRLYGVEFKQQLDSTTVTLTKLDAYQSPEWKDHADDYYKNNWSPVATNGGGTLFNSQHLDKILFYPVVSVINGTQLSTTNPIFDLQGESFFKIADVGGCPECLVLDHSIDGDDIEDMARGFNDELITYSITPNEYTPIAKYKHKLLKPYGTLVNDIYSLPDTNGDNINDIAAMFYHGGAEPNTFVILKGKDWKTVRVQDTEVGNEMLAIGNPFPTPQNASQLQVPIHTTTTGLYELQLFTLDGRMIETVWAKQVDGAQNLTVLVQTSELTAGVYFLRLTNGVHKAEQIVTITR